MKCSKNLYGSTSYSKLLPQNENGFGEMKYVLIGIPSDHQLHLNMGVGGRRVVFHVVNYTARLFFVILVSDN
jgi:hypothetical protein